MESLRSRFNWPEEYVDATAFVECKSAAKMSRIIKALVVKPFCRQASDAVARNFAPGEITRVTYPAASFKEAVCVAAEENGKCNF